MSHPATGTYVDDWYGIYAPARAIIVAHQLGAPVTSEALALARQELASSADNSEAGEPLTYEQHATLMDHLEEAEGWLTTHKAWHNRTAWGWIEGNWGHHITVPYDDRPVLRFYADIHSHDAEPTGPEDAIDSGYFDPNWSRWHPISDGTEQPGWTLDLLDHTNGNYHPETFAVAIAPRVREWVGEIDHLDDHGRTLIVTAAEADDDLRGARGMPLASYWAMRTAFLDNLTNEETVHLIRILSSNA
jgi:hypothetical protein